MSFCPNCKIDVKGNWLECPVCQTSLEMKNNGKNEKSSFAGVPLQYNRQKAIQTFLRYSLIIVFIYFALNYFWPFKFFGLEYVLFGLIITWTIIVILVRKRRNIAKAINYLLFFISLASIYIDYVGGWQGWSITFVVPILSISALVAMRISLRVVKLKVEDYVLYLELAAIAGIVPLLFLIMDWVGHTLPSLISVVFSAFMFTGVLLKYRQMLIRELQKRMHF